MVWHPEMNWCEECGKAESEGPYWAPIPKAVPDHEQEYTEKHLCFGCAEDLNAVAQEMGPKLLPSAAPISTDGRAA